MSIKRELIAKHNGKNIYSFFLSNGNGLSAEILNYGGIIKRLIFKNFCVKMFLRVGYAVAHNFLCEESPSPTGQNNS